ncbi:AraC family transcriptional regulator [Erysipelothrix sp. D19-032]
MLHGANSIGEILDVLESSIEVNHAQTDVKQYNVNVQKALQMIHQNYTDDLTIGTIADSLHLNAMYLGQIFKKETGLSFSQYLNQHRIKKAQNLLMQSSHNVNEIAELVGYTSYGYFYKNFKKECGISPREFRERWHKNGDVLHLD